MLERALLATIIFSIVSVFAIRIAPSRVFHMTAENVGVGEASPDREIQLASGTGVSESFTNRSNSELMASISEERLRARISSFISYSCLFLSVVITAGFLVCVRKQEKATQAASAKDVQTSQSVFDKRQKIYRILSNDLRHLLDGQITASDIMSKELVTVEPQSSAQFAYALMKKRRIHHILVCKNRRLVGIVNTDGLSQHPDGTVAEIMDKTPYTSTKDEDVNTVITSIVERRIPCLPVVENDLLCGVITKSDLLVTLQSVIRVMREMGGAMSETILDPGSSEKISADEFQKKLVPT